MPFIWVAFLSPFLLSSLVSAYDEVDDFCSRWDHQSIVKNNTLYIDGGNELFTSATSSGKPYVLGINQKLIEVDLTTSWDWKTNISIVGVNKTSNPNTGTSPPSLIRGAMYGGTLADTKVYTFGGTKSQLNKTFSNTYPDPSTYSLWSFDTKSQLWDQYDVTSAVPLRPSRGSYTEAPDQGLAFWFDGQADYGSSEQTTIFGSRNIGMQGLIMLNMSSDAGPSARNLSTSQLGSGTAVASSELVYVPQVGSKGVLVEMGGTLISALEAENQNGTLVTFDSVNVLDIASVYTGDGTWYKQATSGDTPPPRIDGCSILAAAPDNSSYNIYLYGGWDPNLDTIYDDMYILSLPSFTWTKMYSGESPRFGHTCHLVGNRQLLAVGGSLNTNVTNGCDWELKSVAIMDISTKKWGSVFNAYAQPYQVTPDLLSVIGGTLTGGATMLAPANGFSDSNLKALFSVQRASVVTSTASASPTSATQSSSPSSNDKKVSAGVIAGAIVAAVAGIAIIIGTALFLLRRRRQQQQQDIRLPSDADRTQAASEKDSNELYEMMGKQGKAAELAGKHTHELPVAVAVYELATGNSRANSRQQGHAELHGEDASALTTRTG